jgi:peptidoglycan/xylan/chitin deacetylase (PgdA/CDA1 family)
MLISVLVRIWDLAVAGVLKLAGRPRRPTCVVLYYHAVPAATRQRFAAQMDCLARRAKPITADHLEPLEPGRHYAAVTFDDGFVCVVQNALPELEARQIPATMFVPTGSLGGPPRWVKDPMAPARSETVLSAEQLRGLAGNRFLGIGSHTVNHPNLARLQPDQALAELADSKTTLESILGGKVSLFSFPHGEHNEALVQQARAVGYQRVFTISPRLAFARANEFVSGRTLVDPADWPLEFSLKLAGAYRWVPMVSALQARLVGCLA